VYNVFEPQLFTNLLSKQVSHHDIWWHISIIGVVPWFKNYCFGPTWRQNAKTILKNNKRIN